MKEYVTCFSFVGLGEGQERQQSLFRQSYFLLIPRRLCMPISRKKTPVDKMAPF